jgi:hypothetical protein
MRVASATTHAAGMESNGMLDPSRPQPALKKDKTNDNDSQNSDHDP